MTYSDGINENIVNCSGFEEHLTDYLDGSLASPRHKAVASHALSCPLCHALLNEVKDALVVCREIASPKNALTKLEARILSKTMPEAAMSCAEFEEHLTDYMDGFLPATVFHRWERHVVLCDACTDLPGEVVRTIAACYTYKMDEILLPAGLHERIMNTTIGTGELVMTKLSWFADVRDWVRGLTFPVSIPRFAPVAMMMIFAVLIMSQTVSADGTLSGMYQKGFELAEKTYSQSADIFGSRDPEPVKSDREPAKGTFVDNQEGK